MNRDIIVILRTEGPNWRIVDKEFETCPESPVYYNRTAIISHDEREPCDPEYVKCLHTLNGQKTQGRVLKRP